MTDDWFSNFNKKIDQLPQSSSDQIASDKVTWERIDGTSREMAFMLKNRTVSVRTWSCKDGAIADGWEEINPGDKTYRDVCNRHRLNLPGDANTIKFKWIDGAWLRQ